MFNPVPKHATSRGLNNKEILILNFILIIQIVQKKRLKLDQEKIPSTKRSKGLPLAPFPKYSVESFEKVINAKFTGGKQKLSFPAVI